MRADFGEASWLCVFVCWQTGELTETVVSCLAICSWQSLIKVFLGEGVCDCLKCIFKGVEESFLGTASRGES